MSRIGTGGLREAGTMSRAFASRTWGAHAAKPREDRMKVNLRANAPAEDNARWLWNRIRTGRISDPQTIAAITREHDGFFKQFTREAA